MSKKKEKEQDVQEEVEEVEETKEEKQPQEIVLAGRAEKIDQPLENAQVFEIKDSAALYDFEFYIVLADLRKDFQKFAHLADERGIVPIKDLPSEYLVQFKCRSIDPGSLKEITNSSLAFETPADLESLPLAEQIRVYEKLRRDKASDPNREYEVRCRVVQACVLEPQFDSLELVKKSLPSSYIDELYNAITESAVGGNVVTRFQKPGKK